jgi:integrase
MSANVKTWQPTRHQHLYRHSSGTYYVRLKRTWRSLKTDVLSIAIKKRDEEIALEAKREETSPEAPPPSLKTVGDAFNVRRRQIQNDVAKKASTKVFWEDIYKALPRVWPGLAKRSLKGISAEECEAWAANYAGGVSASHFNHVLSALRSALEVAVADGVRHTNPFGNIKQKKAVGKDLTLSLPTKGQFKSLVAEIRNSPSRWGHACGDLVEFLAYSGVRIGEAKHIQWKHCDLQRGELIVLGEPTEGTKNRQVRRVPIVPELDKLIRKMATIHRGESLTDHVLKVKSATKSLRTACSNLGMEPLQHHDFRHVFATTCIESGVDIPTISRWLGHTDGGVLAMKTYGHLRNEHSIAAAKKVSFS